MSHSPEFAEALPTPSKALPPSIPSQPSPRSLLDLPAEIRNRIYHKCYSSTRLYIAEHTPEYEYSGCLDLKMLYDRSMKTWCQRTCELDASLCRAQHGMATQLLCANRQVYQEAVPVLYQEVKIVFENVHVLEDHVLRNSLVPVSTLQARPRDSSLHVQNSFAIIQSLDIGSFANLRYGPQSATHQREACRLLEAIKYNMPQLKALDLGVGYPSMMWNLGELSICLWYLHALSQIRNLEVFSFGTPDHDDYLDDETVPEEEMKRRQLAVAYSDVLSTAVFQSLEPKDLHVWCATTDSSQSRLERWSMLKSLMRDFLLDRGWGQALNLLDSLHY